MDNINPQMFYTGVFFLFILISGFWVSRSGKPYNSLFFNIHKLIGLAAGIYLIRTVHLAHQAAPLEAVQWTSIGVTALLFILTVAAGGLLSILDAGNLQSMPQPARTAITWVHKISPYVILVSTALTLYLLLK